MLPRGVGGGFLRLSFSSIFFSFFFSLFSFLFFFFSITGQRSWAGGPPVVPFAKRDRGRGQTKTLRPKCSHPGDPLWSLLPKGTAEGTTEGPKGTAVGTIILTPFLWSLLPKGTAEQHTNAKGTAVGAIILTPFLRSLLRLCLVLWSLLPKGTAEMEP